MPPDRKNRRAAQEEQQAERWNAVGDWLRKDGDPKGHRSMAAGFQTHILIGDAVKEIRDRREGLEFVGRSDLIHKSQDLIGRAERAKGRRLELNAPGGEYKILDDELKGMLDVLIQDEFQTNRQIVRGDGESAKAQARLAVGLKLDQILEDQ